MRAFSKSGVIGLLLAATVVMSVGSAAAATVAKVRRSFAGDRTRVVIDLSTKTPYKAFQLDDPHRIAVNIPNSRLSTSIKTQTFSDGSVRRIRVNRLSWGSQVVLDLRNPVAWEQYALASMDNMPHRVILEIAESGSPVIAKKATPNKAVAARSTPKKSTSAATTKTPPPTSTSKQPTYIIAIDAGHGGSDPGAISNRVVEKSAALDISKRVAAEINKQSHFKAVLTRKKDVYLTLPRRTSIAKQKNADVFISIHLNSAKRRSARGAEIFFLSPSGAAATASRLMSDKDRAARELGLQGTSSDDVLFMLVNGNQQAMMKRSSLLAEEILKSVRRTKGLPPTRSVKQRSFAVLKSISMPSVIVETGFLTNSKDAAILKSDKGKDVMAAAIADGIVSFMKKYPPPADHKAPIIVHRVTSGETLWKISRKYRTSVAMIQESNKMGKSNTIRVGQELVIRGGYETN